MKLLILPYMVAACSYVHVVTVMSWLVLIFIKSTLYEYCYKLISQSYKATLLSWRSSLIVWWFWEAPKRCRCMVLSNLCQQCWISSFFQFKQQFHASECSQRKCTSNLSSMLDEVPRHSGMFSWNMPDAKLRPQRICPLRSQFQL